jgi:hypothetical protein
MVAFRSHPQGADSVYRFAFKGPVKAMAQILDKAGVSNRIFVPHGQGTHVYLYDQGRKLHQPVGDLVMRLGLQAIEHHGDGQLLGGGDDLGRSGYRDEIKQHEASNQQQERSGVPVRMAASDNSAIHQHVASNPLDRAAWGALSDSLYDSGHPWMSLVAKKLAMHNVTHTLMDGSKAPMYNEVKLHKWESDRQHHPNGYVYGMVGGIPITLMRRPTGSWHVHISAPSSSPTNPEIDPGTIGTAVLKPDE